MIIPEWGSFLRNYYFFIRESRGASKYSRAQRRKYYRYAYCEKKRLASVGVDAELIRLYCRWLSDPRNSFARERYFLRFNSLKLSYLMVKEKGKGCALNHKIE